MSGDSALAGKEEKKKALLKKMESLSWTQKKQLMKEFKDADRQFKHQKEADPKHHVKLEYHRGKLSAFAAQDLLRLYEIMDESQTAIKLEIRNNSRLKLISKNLDLSRRENPLKMRECQLYEKKKKDKRFFLTRPTVSAAEAREKLKALE